MSAMVLSGGTVVTSLSPPRVERMNLGLAGSRVVELSPGRLSGHPQVDCGGCLIMPGLVCAHHHLYSSLARGMPYALAPPRSFLEILRRIWWRLDRALDRRSVWWSATAGGAEALLAGTTTIVDHHASPNAVEETLSEVGGALGHLGARAVLAYEVTDRDGLEVAGAGLKEVRRFEEGRGELSPGGTLLRTMVGAHASFTLSQDTLRACVDTAGDLGVGIHLHVAEDAVDQRDAEARFGKRVVGRLSDAGVLEEKALLAHCIHLDDDELDTIRASGATAVHNPRSNMNNGVGRMRVDRFDRLALGTDGIGGDMLAGAQAG
jgi:cytosine/adenosine deaminase-related metal-dependent hydrolase